MPKPSGFSIESLQRIRLAGLTALGRYPWAFSQVAALGSGRDTLVSPTTALCVEAPPRSGNSFFVVGFSMANPGLRVAHHHHVPAQVMNAIALNVPVITILRNPIDSALAKAAPGNERFLIGTTLKKWVSFWRPLQRILPAAFPVPFERLVGSPSGVIAAINQRYGTAFSTQFPETGSVFASIEGSRLATLGPDAANTPSPNVPDPRTALKEAALRPDAEAHPMAATALDLYDKLSEMVDRL
jgi:hypothetical protein